MRSPLCGVFTFGHATFYGSLGAAPVSSGVLRMVSGEVVRIENFGGADLPPTGSRP